MRLKRDCEKKVRPGLSNVLTGYLPARSVMGDMPKLGAADDLGGVAPNMTAGKEKKFKKRYTRAASHAALRGTSALST